jgi:phosphoadenosine phosphosulfate reductase
MSGEEIRFLRRRYGDLEGHELLEDMLLGPLRGRTALVSSFGSESVILLHMVSRIDRRVPVIFLDTLAHFPATLAYRDELVDRLGLLDVRSATPDATALGRHDPLGTLHKDDPDSCCHLRKTEPLEAALEGFDAWITGRKRFQGGLRSDLEPIELDPASGRIKLNPLARWSEEAIEGYRRAYRLPSHPLLRHGYRSVGCAPCTRPVAAGENPRAGRWHGIDKVECGIHLGAGRPSAPTHGTA